MLTYQDFLKAGENKLDFVNQLIGEYRSSEFYQIACDAELYNKQQNVTINNYVKRIFSIAGAPIEDFTASNNKLSSNFFRRLNTQRCTYSLGAGVSFKNGEKTKGFLGDDFDTRLWDLGYKALIHGVCYGFWNVDKLHVFPALEFAPLWDEEDGTLKAGVRFWQLDSTKPLIAVLYEFDGYTKYKTVDFKLTEAEPKKAYKTKVAYTEIGGEEVIGEENYSSLPIIPMWGSKLHQSTLIGIRASIDSYDLIRSGFANDLTDCSEIYWLIENAGGMNEEDLARFRDRLKITHIAEVDGDAGAKATPYTQEIPYAARKEYLDMMRAGIYEDFGGLDVHVVAAGATNDHIDAAYQPMDENADDFEYNVTEFVRQLLKLIGIDDYPLFKRNRISNEMEQTQMVLSAATYLDDETVLKKLPFVTVDEIPKILENTQAERDSIFSGQQNEEDDEDDDEQEGEQ